MFNPYKSSHKIKDEFVDYITTLFPFNDMELKDKFHRLLSTKISKGPYIDIKPVFESSLTIEDLIKKNELSKLFYELESKKYSDKNADIILPLKRPLYTHQIDAIRKTNCGKNLVVTTGTGSGKTECFLIPIIEKLLEEKEKNGFISNKVKVIIIYPMNALANDQMKRLRNLLMYYPDITFGLFTGETKIKKDAALKAYADAHYCENNEKLKNGGLPNEIKSREEIRDRFPHILITNYAMLERMLLVPKNGIIFDNSDIKYIVLDEAHVYTGARGMETSLLIRRLLARIHGDKTKFILTSATLGKKNESEGEICEFGRNLTSGTFEKDGIIFGKRKFEKFIGGNIDIPIDFFSEIAEGKDSIKKIYSKFNLEYNDGVPEKENLYDICYNSSYYGKIRTELDKNTKSVFEVGKLHKILGTKTIDEAISFIFTCSLCEKNKTNLMDSRYHYFLRALEGCYISFSCRNNIFIERKKIDDLGYKIFELSVCKKCGDLALYGYITNDEYLEQKSYHDFDLKNEKPQYFHFSTELADDEIEDIDTDSASVEDEVSDDEFKDKKGKYNIIKYYLCPKCGKISKVVDGKPLCDCDCSYIKVYSVKSKRSKDTYRGCLSCKSGKYNKFYLGNSAATGVIGTSLFEELPVKSILRNQGGMAQYYDGGKQYLIFSDSTSDAAYFATYMDKTYETFLRRRAIFKIMQMKEKTEVNKPWDLNHLVQKVQQLFYEKKTFKQDVITDGDHLSHMSEKNAWYGVLTELAGQNGRNSLQSLGILRFEYAGLDILTKNYLNHPDFNVDSKICRSVLNEIIMTIACWGAVKPDNYTLLEEDKRYIFYSGSDKLITKKKEYDEKSQDAYMSRNISSWLPRTKKNNPNEFIKNKRYYLSSLLLKTKDDFLIKQFLVDIFDFITLKINPEYQLSMNTKNKYYLKSKSIVVRSFNDEKLKWYKCSKCGTISSYSIEGECTINGCEGDTIEIQQEEIVKNNHYYNLYNKDSFYKLFIKEHTAQISSEDAARYQRDFEQNKINALSCSTTFEMGVDLGALETVFLRDFPPSASNYTQRSGRAGRSNESSAYTITYAKLSSHDFNYFDKPLTMISGKIMPPKFKINNQKILMRHIYDVVFGYCFQQNQKLYKFKNLFNFDSNGEGIEEIRKIVNSKPRELTRLLTDSFKDINTPINIEQYEWTDQMLGDNGAFTNLIEDYNSTDKNYRKLVGELKKQIIEDVDCNNLLKRLRFVNIQKKHFENQRTIDALSRGNVIPKYGFPVDVVELDIGEQNVSLNRDLSLAISEYAPGSTIVADGKKYVSRYIKKRFYDKKTSFDIRYFCECPECHTYNYSQTPVYSSNDGLEASDNDVNVCSGCGNKLSSLAWKEIIVPISGFRKDIDANEFVSIAKNPKKLYASEDFYVGHRKPIMETEYITMGNSINIKHTEDDEIMVVTKNYFYVCDYCGYTYSILDTVKDKNGKPDKKVKMKMQRGEDIIKINSDHKNYNGAKCKNHQFKKEYLAHIYKTDVVQIDFNSRNSIDSPSYETMLSVMTALLDSISYSLDIERNDLSGCVKRKNSSYCIILYDAVPGGAGHVKRLLEKQGKNLEIIIKNALVKMKNCTCGSSCYNCLRSYYNQQYHDKLDRYLVLSFLEKYAGELKMKELAPSHIQQENYSIQRMMKNKGSKNDLEFISILEEIKEYNFNNNTGIIDELIKSCENVKLPRPTYCDSNFVIDGKNISADCFWENQKLFLLDNSSQRRKLYENMKQDHNFHVFILDESFEISSFISLLKGEKNVCSNDSTRN